MYAVVAVTGMFGLVSILNASQPEKPEAGISSPYLLHSYERGSIMFTRFVLLSSFVVAFLFGWLAWAGQLPGQTFSFEKEAELGFPQEHMFKDKTRGIMIPVSLGVKLFPNGVPPQLNMQITINAELKMTWEVEPVVLGFIDEGGTEKRMDPQPVVLTETEKAESTTVLLDGLSRDKRYLLKTYLHAREKDTPSQQDVAKAIESINSRKGMRVIFLTKEKK